MSGSLSIWLDWEQARPLIAAEMVRRGYPSLTAFGETVPQADLVDLAQELAIAGLHSGHLLRRLWEEGTEAGELARCGKDLLVRALCASFQEFDGHPAALPLCLENALYQWRNNLPRNYQFVADRIRSTLLSVTPPPDWIPENANDSILAGLFHHHWPVEVPASRYRLTCDDAGITIEPSGERRRADPLVTWPPKT